MSGYDDKTEILTEKGWIFLKDLTIEHRVATLINSEELLYEHPLIIKEHNYSGKMYLLETSNINLCMTPNNNVWISHDSGIFKLISVDKIFSKQVKYQKNIIKYLEKNTKVFYKILLECGKDNDLSRFKTSRVLDIMAKTSQPHLMYHNILLELSQTEQKSKTDISDHFQRLALHVGLSMNIENMENNISILKIISKNKIIVNKDFQQDKWIDYSGKIYTCQVSSGVVYLRRNGIPIFSGVEI
ncbi:Hint (Hedgehog/Intein) domain-containing protein [Acanthamoeba polyphaga moumouvirus]|uniref:Hint (Hedgehog/Intein) domain-containing protein n=1 Tax=Acanthamoeba polyphaga moumouvirus TaxID=1269028 RepID=L7RBW0_9VIRU|nr:Hint (Hedgehog/Intein) domain-containing protein [Acanthamoeba polyphaga moumouvirus]AGC01641.1 Hint (Hedgehog/Intein) domain-containing protein [Acanthamoeba polyphaga moumouvirus]